MLRNNRELWASFLVGFLITGVYGAVIYFTRKIPAAGELFGHTLGIFGFIMMLMTETLYSLRKRSRARIGGGCPAGFSSISLRDWLDPTWSCCIPRGSSTGWRV